MSKLKGLFIFLAFTSGFICGTFVSLYADVKDIIVSFYDDLKDTIKMHYGKR